MTCSGRLRPNRSGIWLNNVKCFYTRSLLSHLRRFPTALLYDRFMHPETPSFALVCSSQLRRINIQHYLGNAPYLSPFSYHRIILNSFLNHTLNLEEASQPPDLEEGLANNDTNNEHVPPLDSAVCALGGVSVGALTHNDVLLFVLDLGKEIG